MIFSVVSLNHRTAPNPIALESKTAIERRRQEPRLKIFAVVFKQVLRQIDRGFADSSAAARAICSAPKAEKWVLSSRPSG